MNMVEFYDREDVADEKLKYAVICAHSGDGWILCRHHERSTWEIPGGHREQGEDIVVTAKRELYEETGAIDYTLEPVCVYKVSDYGMLCFAEVKSCGSLPKYSEICETACFDALPEMLTYPDIQPYLHKYIETRLKSGEINNA